MQFEELTGDPQPIRLSALRSLRQIGFWEYAGWLEDPRKRLCNRLAQRR